MCIFLLNIFFKIRIFQEAHIHIRISGGPWVTVYPPSPHVYTKIFVYIPICIIYIFTVGEKEASLLEIRSGFEFVPGLFGMVLDGGYLYGAWPRTVLILIEFKFIVPELWHLVVFCTCRILPEGLKFVQKFPLRYIFQEACESGASAHSPSGCVCVYVYIYTPINNDDT